MKTLTEEQEVRRLKFIEFREEKRYSRKELASKLGVSVSMISNIENGLTAIPDTWQKKIIEVFSYDYLKGYEVHVEKEFTTVTSNIIPIPFYHIKAAANPTGELMINYAEAEALYFDKRWLKNVLGINPYNASIIKAKGDSMDSGFNKSDDIKNGDLLLIDNSDTNIVNNKTYIIEIGDKLLVKKVVQDFDGTISLISNNERYLPRILTECDNALIKGRVVWNGSRENI